MWWNTHIKQFKHTVLIKSKMTYLRKATYSVNCLLLLLEVLDADTVEWKSCTLTIGPFFVSRLLSILYYCNATLKKIIMVSWVPGVITGLYSSHRYVNP